MSNSFDPDQARRFVGPNLGPNCLQKFSADKTTNVVGKYEFSFQQKKLPDRIVLKAYTC